MRKISPIYTLSNGEEINLSSIFSIGTLLFPLEVEKGSTLISNKDAASVTLKIIGGSQLIDYTILLNQSYFNIALFDHRLSRPSQHEYEEYHLADEKRQCEIIAQLREFDNVLGSQISVIREEVSRLKGAWEEYLKMRDFQR